MDVKKQLTKIEECKKDAQRKDLVKALCEYLSKPKNQKTLVQLSKHNYDKTISKLYSIKEYSLFLELLISIIQNIPSLSDNYRNQYQETALTLIIPKIENNYEAIKKNFDYFLIITKDLDDISNIKHKEYLIYFMFFNVLLKMQLEPKILDLFIKLEKYMTKYQYEMIIYILTIYSFANKSDNPEDFENQMLIIPKIIDFCKIKFHNDKYLKNYDILKNLVLMLLLHSPFKQEILMELYTTNPNLFMEIIQDIINYIDNKFRDLYINEQQDNNSFYNKYCDKNNSYLINIYNFFSDDLLLSDLDDLNFEKNILYNYFNYKTPLIEEYMVFMNRINLKGIQERNKINIFKGIIWTVSSILLKNYYIDDNPTDKKNALNSNENKNHCIRLFNSLIALFQFVDKDNEKIFVKQYLELIKSLLNQSKLLEDWDYVLSIIDLCLNIIIKRDSNKENIEKQFKIEINILNEIFSKILNFYNENNLFYCDLEFLSLMMHKFNQFLQKDILVCFYINIYLVNEHKNKKNVIDLKNDTNNIYANFINNIETIVYNILSSSPKKNISAKNYLMEILRINYIYDNINDENENISSLKNKNNEIISKQIEIEKVLLKYFENFFISFGDNEINYAFFNYVLTEILSKSRNIEFVKHIITTLIFYNNDNIDKSLYDNFVEQILGNLFENTINDASKYILSHEKLEFLMSFFYDENYMNDKSIIKIALKLIKNFKVNSQYEVIYINSNYYNSYLINNINYHHKHSMIVIDYKYNKIQQYKKKFESQEEYELYHKNYYAPFTLFKHIELFSALNNHLMNNIKKTQIFENILEFYYLCLNRNLYFLKGVNFKEFLNILLKEKDITKISSSKKSTYYLLKILSCLPYQLQSDLSFSSSSQIVLKIKNSSYRDDEVQLIVDPKFKLLSINCLLNFWNTLNSSIANTLNKIFSNEQLNQTLFNNNKTFNEKTVKNIVDNIMRTGELYLWCGELNLYTEFEYMYNCIKILKLYLISSINDILFVKKNSINYNNYDDKNLKEDINALINNNPNSFSSIKSIIQKIFSQIFNSLNYKYLNKKYVYYILSLLFEIKEFIILFILKDDKKENINNYKKSFSNSNINSQLNNIIDINLREDRNKDEGINLIFETIFISMFLSWNYEDKIIEKFDKYLKTNYKMKILNKDKYVCINKYYQEKNNFDDGIQELIENISDNLNLYLMEYIPQKNSNVLINILDEILPNKASYREYFFYKMSEWTLKIKKNRNAMNIDYRNIYDIKYLNNFSYFGEDPYIGEKVLINSQVFYGNNSLIIINPINMTKYCFTLRNPISHMNLIFDSKIPIINNANIKEEIDKELDEEEEEENNEEPDLNKQNQNLTESISNSFSSESDEFNKKDDEIIPEFLRKTTKHKLNSKYDIADENDKEVSIFDFEESSEKMLLLQRKKSENNINKIYEINNQFIKNKSKENAEKTNNINKPQIFRRQRYNSDLGDKFRASIIFAEQKKKMADNSLKLFSIISELTDFKVEKYKWIDLTKNNNLFNITKLVQYLDLLPLYFCYNCGLIYYSEGKSDSECLASYMFFIEKLGSLFDYYDFYPDKNKKDLSSKLINKDNEKDKYIIINQDSFIRINFHVLNLTDKNKNKIIEENNIIFIWVDNLNNSYEYNTNLFNNKLKVFLIISKITENYYKIQRKYNQMGKTQIIQVIEELFINDIIIDINNQSSIQLLLNMIMNIDILIKINNKSLDINKIKSDFMKKQNELNNNNQKEDDTNNVKKIILDNQNVIISDDYVSSTGTNKNFEDKDSYLNENDIMDENISSFRKRYELINKLCQE